MVLAMHRRIRFYKRVVQPFRKKREVFAVHRKIRFYKGVVQVLVFVHTHVNSLLKNLISSSVIDFETRVASISELVAQAKNVTNLLLNLLPRVTDT